MTDSSTHQFSHLDKHGDPNMVNVGEKKVTKRTARARAIVLLTDEILAQMTGNSLVTKKGAVFQTAIIAGIMAAKKTDQLIPLCHSLPLEKCDVNLSINEDNELIIESLATLHGKTGVEMEAMTAVSIAALTVYDMCKAFSHHIIIKEIRLIEKSGGKRDFKL